MKNRLTNQLAILVSWYPCDAIISLAIYTHNSNDQSLVKIFQGSLKILQDLHEDL